MPSTLLTGANSFFGAHVINTLIQAGHKITGTVRRAAAADEVFALHPEWKDHVEMIIVDDITNEARWDEVFKTYTFDHVIHTASPLPDNPANSDYDRDYLAPNVEGNLALLRAAHKNAPGLKSIVVTGSINASSSGSPEELSSPITNETWNTITREQARTLNNPFLMYCSGKKEGELALWDYVKANELQFTVTVFLPGLIFGPPLEPVHGGAKGLHLSSGIIYSLFNGTSKTIPPTMFPSYVDARDLALAHVRALTEPKVAGKRLLVGGQQMTNTELVHALSKLPELAGRLPEESGEDKNVTPAVVEASEANEALGLTLTGLEKTMSDTAKRILELESQA
ncbi:NAD(P)-binding protein [Thozetella sp. PMI_491]|nr:NAD(P)-binding protein [Thozetella sp. PMI_491]